MDARGAQLGECLFVASRRRFSWPLNALLFLRFPAIQSTEGGRAVSHSKFGKKTDNIESKSNGNDKDMEDERHGTFIDGDCAFLLRILGV